MKGHRSLLLSCFLAFALVHSSTAALEARQGGLGSIFGNTESNTNTATNTATSNTATTGSQTETSKTSATSTGTPTSATSTTSATSNANSNTSTKSAETTANTQQTQSTTSPPSQSVVVSTGADGGTVFVTQTLSSPTDSSSSSSSSATSSSAADSNTNKSSTLGTGSIIGLSVAGGVAVLGIVAFFIWKFTRKRFSDFDDNEAIKWPELNSHTADGGDSHPLPVNSTGRAGFDTGSEVSLSRAPSSATHNFSTPDFGNDPYAVPPLPHLNPNQPLPYRDDPAGAGAYYDPYRGPVPGTFSEPGTATEWGPHGEAIPMTQMAGRASPGPSMMGRMSPGPGAAYDMGRGATPVPNMGRASPGPQMAYDNYGAR